MIAVDPADRVPTSAESVRSLSRGLGLDAGRSVLPALVQRGIFTQEDVDIARSDDESEQAVAIRDRVTDTAASIARSAQTLIDDAIRDGVDSGDFVERLLPSLEAAEATRDPRALQLAQATASLAAGNFQQNIDTLSLDRLANYRLAQRTQTLADRNLPEAQQLTALVRNATTRPTGDLDASLRQVGRGNLLQAFGQATGRGATGIRNALRTFSTAEQDRIEFETEDRARYDRELEELNAERQTRFNELTGRRRQGIAQELLPEADRQENLAFSETAYADALEQLDMDIQARIQDVDPFEPMSDSAQNAANAIVSSFTSAYAVIDEAGLVSQRNSARLARLGAIANGALAVTEILSQHASNPGLAAGLITLTSASVAAQVAVIDQQQPQVERVAARQFGGPVDAGRLYQVGEDGPELFRSNSSGTIIPNNQVRETGGYINNVSVSVGVGFGQNALETSQRVGSDVVQQFARGVAYSRTRSRPA